ncbi:hypothetical protein DJ70_10590 [Halorubrum halodurans]|uniref:Uncharacterized protein n=1 Tax=Halorubrum halodurans TaxID=1383851 RepID=A0A256IH62_9EURY|nr:hypothetical protein DJ70_10590 [Halorubrum halodurans]
MTRRIRERREPYRGRRESGDPLERWSVVVGTPSLVGSVVSCLVVPTGTGDGTATAVRERQVGEPGARPTVPPVAAAVFPTRQQVRRGFG